MNKKTVFLSKAGFVGVLVANGEAELALQHVSEPLPILGNDVIGPLPSDLQEPIVTSAAIMGDTRDVDAAKALVNFSVRVRQQQ